MYKNQQSGNIALNILLIVVLVVIAVLIYILAGGKIPKIGDTVGVSSPDTQIITEPQNIPTSVQSDGFSDGLGTPQESSKFPLDEFGAGIAERDIFMYDINNDGRPDRITRTRNENGTPHFYYEYTIELNTNNGFINITPDGFRTTEGAECALQKLQFSFTPDFRITKISRNWRDSWDTPSPAVRTTYKIKNNAIIQTDMTNMPAVCDVRELFN